MSRRAFATFLSPVFAGTLILAIGMAGLAQPSPTASKTSSSPGAVMASSTPSVEGIIEMILHRNPGLSSYRAHARLDIRQLTFPWLHPILDGSENFSSPSYLVYDFPHAPKYLGGITKLAGAVGLVGRWRYCYDITVADQPGAYVLRMVPKIRGEVSQLDVSVAKNGAELERLDWSYQGSNDHLTLTQYYNVVGSYSVVTLQRYEVHRHHIRAKVTGTYDGFQYNVPVPTPTPTPSDPLHQCDN